LEPGSPKPAARLRVAMPGFSSSSATRRMALGVIIFDDLLS
jgi:hypothetical protein